MKLCVECDVMFLHATPVVEEKHVIHLLLVLTL